MTRPDGEILTAAEKAAMDWLGHVGLLRCRYGELHPIKPKTRLLLVRGILAAAATVGEP